MCLNWQSFDRLSIVNCLVNLETLIRSLCWHILVSSVVVPDIDTRQMHCRRFSSPRCIYPAMLVVYIYDSSVRAQSKNHPWISRKFAQLGKSGINPSLEFVELRGFRENYLFTAREFRGIFVWNQFPGYKPLLVEILAIPIFLWTGWEYHAPVDMAILQPYKFSYTIIIAYFIPFQNREMSFVSCYYYSFVLCL